MSIGRHVFFLGIALTASLAIADSFQPDTSIMEGAEPVNASLTVLFDCFIPASNPVRKGLTERDNGATSYGTLRFDAIPDHKLEYRMSYYVRELGNRPLGDKPPQSEDSLAGKNVFYECRCIVHGFRGSSLSLFVHDATLVEKSVYNTYSCKSETKDGDLAFLGGPWLTNDACPIQDYSGLRQGYRADFRDVNGALRFTLRDLTIQWLSLSLQSPESADLLDFVKGNNSVPLLEVDSLTPHVLQECRVWTVKSNSLFSTLQSVEPRPRAERLKPEQESALRSVYALLTSDHRYEKASILKVLDTLCTHNGRMAAFADYADSMVWYGNNGAVVVCNDNCIEACKAWYRREEADPVGRPVIEASLEREFIGPQKEATEIIEKYSRLHAFYISANKRMAKVLEEAKSGVIHSIIEKDVYSTILNSFDLPSFYSQRAQCEHVRKAFNIDRQEKDFLYLSTEADGVARQGFERFVTIAGLLLTLCTVFSWCFVRFFGWFHSEKLSELKARGEQSQVYGLMMLGLVGIIVPGILWQKSLVTMITLHSIACPLGGLAISLAMAIATSFLGAYAVAHYRKRQDIEGTTLPCPWRLAAVYHFWETVAYTKKTKAGSLNKIDQLCEEEEEPET